jgi:hypothetical protein
VKIQQPRLYSKFFLQSWKTFSSFLECRRKFGSNYMRELLGTLPVHSHWALFVSQCRSSTALRSKQIGQNCMHTAGKKNSNKKDIVFYVTKSDLMPIKRHASRVFLTCVQGKCFGLKIGFFGLMLVLLGAFNCVWFSARHGIMWLSCCVAL